MRRWQRDMKKDSKKKVADTEKIQCQTDDATAALAQFQGSGHGGAVARLLADRKAENTELPVGWTITKLGDFVENDKGKKPKSESTTKTETHTFPYVDIQAFEENVIRSWTDGIGCRFCFETDFLMVWDGSRSGLVGKGLHGALGSTLVRINFPSMVNDYAYYFLQSKYLEINSRAKGSGTPHVDPDLLWNYDFPIPPLPEQKRIVAKIEELFSELDKGIESFKTAREQLKVYRQALLKHAFEGKLTAAWREANKDKLETVDALLKRIHTERAERYKLQLKEWEQAVKEWEKSNKKGSKTGKPAKPKELPPLTAAELAELPELPDGWGWVPLENACYESVLGKMLDKEKNKGILKPYLRNINVRWGSFDLSNLLEMRFEEHEVERYSLVDGDLVICEGGEPGRCAIWRKEFASEARIQKALHRVRFTSAIRPDFIQKYFELCNSSRRIEKYFTGTTIKHLTGNGLSKVPLPTCSTSEQIQTLQIIDEKLSEIDNLDQTITTALQQAETLRQSILKKAFSGQLVPQDPSDEPAAALLARIKAERAANSGKTGSRSTKRTPRTKKATP